LGETLTNAVFGSLPGRRWIQQRTLQTVNIVYYHWVGERTAHYAEFYQGCTLERFRQDLEFFFRHFEIVPLDRLIGPDACIRPQETPRLAVTFDDGFDLNRREVLQLLNEFRVKATTLVITECLDNTHLMWRNKLSVIREQVATEICLREYNALMTKVGYPIVRRPEELVSASLGWEMSRKDELASELWKRCGLLPVEDYLGEHQPYFTRKGLRDWISAGHTVGLHTSTHPRCSLLNSDEITREIVEPARELKRELGVNQLAFSYPFGDRLPEEMEEKVVREAGLSCVLGIRGFAPLHTPRNRLERQGVERTGANWGVIARAAIRGAQPVRRAVHSHCPSCVRILYRTLPDL
jgi:peptidoglycan/xylan/chitin deacetylase (PgdA/CDA1 family)